MNPVEPGKRSPKIAYEVSGPAESQPERSLSSEGLSFEEEGSLQQVRDILFGAQSREFDQRCCDLENRLLQETNNLREEITRSLEHLKTNFTRDVSQLKQQLQQEEGSRTTSLAELGRVIQKMGEKLEEQFSQLTQQTSQQSAILKGQMTQQKADITEHHNQRMEELQQHIQEGLQAMKTEKTDRAVLAEMLMDMALRLKLGSQESSDS